MRGLILFLLLTVQVAGFSQEKITTFILTRHAEKANDGTKDPDLTDAGKIRADQLVKLLHEQSVDAIYSTDFKRTQNTVMPLAKVKNVVISRYEAFKTEAIDEIVVKHRGGTIFMCGHSNSIPWTINYLIGKEQYKDFEDSDYDNLVIITLFEKGKAAKVTWLNY